VIAEEEVAAGRIPAHDDCYFLVDPLDGTKEFVRGGDDYTVNIGLIESGAPKLGIVFAPATGRLHGACVGGGAWVDEGHGRRPIRTPPRGEQVTAVASKSHHNQATIDYLEAAVGTCGYVSIGSSLKFCIVAEGEADIYPRAAPTSEWDTAAGHAVLLAAGGLVDGPDGRPLRYGKPTFLNRAFVATSGWKPPKLEGFLEPFSGGGEIPHGV
jgi:3'(2'), 5'-bisphosphate nucleotidase